MNAERVCSMFVEVRAEHDDPALKPTDAVAAGRSLWVEQFGYTDAGASMEMASQLVRVREILVHSYDRLLKEIDLTFIDYDILSVVGSSENEEIPLSRIGPLGLRLFNHQTSITNVVSRLAKRRFVKLRPDADDGRVTIVGLTKAGRGRLAEANSRLARVSFGVGTLNRTELSDLVALLVTVRRAHQDAPS